ncbi:MAG TPA: HD domain-containing phosphohydrolase [Thermoanaerobaculaceae bacterium]|nr:HD domain-containing phosphohydrolase [Thermoanaerobaculaceae bacterium]
MLPPLSPEAELRLKQLLYRCMEELEATKAALYLAGSDGNFELCISYGFGRRDSLVPEIRSGHPLWDWVRRHRTTPAYVNSAVEFPELQATLEGAGTARLITIPLAVGDRLTGLIDARDKARKQPFSAGDVPVGRQIATAVEMAMKELGLYGVPTQPAPAVATSSVTASATEATFGLYSAWVIEQVTGFVRTLATLPEISAAVLTISDGKAVRSLALRGVPLEESHKDAVSTHQRQCLEAGGVRLANGHQWTWEEIESGSPHRGYEEISTALLYSGTGLGIAISLLTPSGSEAGEPALQLVNQHFRLAHQMRAYRRAARNLARTLLEPGETAYPHLRQHSQAVSELTQRLAVMLRLSEEDEETVTIAAYLHDVGMRELDYAKLYRLEKPGEADLRTFQRHPVVGARLVEGAEFPGDLTRAIRHHHERWDGTGYPHRLVGRAIPLAARLIHLAEVYDTLTSSSSYKRPVAREAALDILRGEAGKQFDPELVPLMDEATRG